MSTNYKEQLKPVFDLCDVEQKGYISVQHFIDLAKENFGASEQSEEVLQSVVTVLDPEGDGRIDFSDFCRGVKQILDLKSPSTPPALLGMPGPGLSSMHVGSEETLVPADQEDSLSCGTHDNSELSTFNEYDMMTDDDVTQLGLSSTNHMSDDADSAISSRSPDYNSTKQFEDFGEGNEADTETDSHRPLRKTLAPHGSRRAATNPFASHIFQNSSIRSMSSNGGSRRSSCSDEIYDDIDGSFNELTDKVRKLEEQLSDLTEKHETGQKKQVKMKEENTQLIERMHMLEEQVRDVEMKAHERIEEERKKRRELQSKTDKEKSQEIELLTQGLQTINGEYQYLKDEAPRLRVENERLKKETVELTRRLSAAQQQLETAQDEQMVHQQRLHSDKAHMEQERQINAQLLDELSKELEELRTYKCETEQGVRSAPNDLTRTQRQELEAHVSMLKEENARLRESFEDLQNQVLGAHVREGRRLVQSGPSIAQEIENLPRDELMRKLKEAQEMNMKMHDYVDRMTLKIIEKHPSLLEI